MNNKQLIKKLAALDPATQTDAIIDLINSCPYHVPKELDVEDSNDLLEKWSDIKRASPAPMTDEEYKKFILGYN